MKELIKIDGVVSVGKTKEGVEVEIYKGTSPALPNEINGQPVIVKELEKEEDEVYLKPGKSIRNGSAGLFFNKDGYQLMVTAHHVFLDEKNTKKGQEFFNLGEVYDWVDVWSENPGAGDIGILKMRRRGHNEINGIEIKGLAKPELDMEVYRAGISTGFVKTKITAVESTINRQDGRTWEKMFRFDKDAVHGDSGGLIFTEDGKAVGITSTTRHGASIIPALEVMGYSDLDLSKPSKNEIVMSVDSTSYTHNGFKGEMDTKPVIRDGRTLVPLRFISETLGYYVHWDSSKREVTIKD